MFLQASVILLTGGEGYLTPPGLRIPPGLRTPPGLCTLPPGLHTPQLCTPQTTYPPRTTPRGRSMCGRYASYWNAFLLLYHFSSVSPSSSFSSLPQMLLLFTLIEANLWVTILCWKLFAEQFDNRYKSDTLVKILMDDFYIWLWNFDVKCIDFTSHMLC